MSRCAEAIEWGSVLTFLACFTLYMMRPRSVISEMPRSSKSLSFISCETAVARDREGGQVRTSRVALYSRRMTHREASAVDLLGREQVEDTLL